MITQDAQIHLLVPCVMNRHTLSLKKAMTSPRLRSDSTGSGKAKMTKMLVECRREGIVRQLAEGADAAQPRWDKCRLVLVRTTGGDLLEFYIPPKVVIFANICV